MWSVDRVWEVSVLVLVVLACSSCVWTDEQAVRHAVTAELIVRYRVSEDQVHLVQVERASGAWLVRAEISPGGRAGGKRIVTCRVERSVSSATAGARWTLATMEDKQIESVGADPKR